jgi:hypothetical protein
MRGHPVEDSFGIAIGKRAAPAVAGVEFVSGVTDRLEREFLQLQP